MKSRSIHVRKQLPPELVFVYGTLQSQHWNNFHLDGSEFKGRGETVCRFPLIAPRLPILLPIPGQGHQVTGELYLVPSYVLLYRLDRLEGHPNWYRRRKISILSDGNLHEAWTYFICPEYIPKNWEQYPLLSSY